MAKFIITAEDKSIGLPLPGEAKVDANSPEEAVDLGYRIMAIDALYRGNVGAFIQLMNHKSNVVLTARPEQGDVPTSFAD